MEINQEIKEIENLSNRVDNLRVKLREELNKTRDLHRSAAFDKNRFLDNEIITEKDVTGICSRIKRRKHADNEDLIKLSTAFYQSEANISAFMKITGAINVIVKEFIGSERQILAAQTLCNLSLGNDACCSKIATFAGAYLMIYMRNLTAVNLNKICLWTAQNLISSDGHKALDILMSQELLLNTLNIMINSGEHELKHEAAQLLDLIIERKWKDLGMDTKEEVSKSILDYTLVNKNVSYIGLQCLYRIVSFEGCWNFSKDDSLRIFDLLAGNVTKLTAESDEHLIYYSIKIIFAIFQSETQFLAAFIENLLETCTKLSNIINEIVKKPKFFSLVKDLMSIGGLIAGCTQPVAVKYLEFDDLVNNLELPRYFDF